MRKSGLPPYGTAIQDAIITGDLAKMKQIEAEAEKHLKDTGNVSAALESLMIEIAKQERKV